MCIISHRGMEGLCTLVSSTLNALTHCVTVAQLNVLTHCVTVAQLVLLPVFCPKLQAST